MKLEILDPRRLVFTVHGFLSAPECEDFIITSESVGFRPAPITTRSGPVMAPEVRNHGRVMVDRHDLARTLWPRVRPLVPRTLKDSRDGQREAAGLNERFRFFRYEHRERFARHYDAPYVRDASEESLLSFVVYLNEGFEGGDTRFYTDDLELRFAVRPCTGTALFYDHNQLHEGAAVVGGRKYVMRTDVMYQLEA
ncbi:MAG: 2OG-Fe(II) oxygenase [Armatimonadetes bacterium]|nr:2OG-Fe(II) oxygenase [Armatimonadota bacterium]